MHSVRLFRVLVILVATCLIMLGICESNFAREAAKVDPYPPPSPPFRTLVSDGKPRAVVVAPAKRSPAEAHAVDEFIRYVKKITNVELEVVTSVGGKMLPVYIGAAARTRLTHVAWDALGTDEFVLRSGADGINLNDAAAVAAAHQRAITIGEPMSIELKDYCRKNGLKPYPRLIDVHDSIRDIVPLPGRRSVLLM